MKILKNVATLTLIFAASNVSFADEAKIVPTGAPADYSDYTIPVYFDVNQNGITMPPPELEYELKRNGDIQLGNITIDGNSVQLDLKKQQPANSGLYLIQFSWSKSVMTTGHIDLRAAADDKTFYSYNVSPDDISSWISLSSDNKSYLSADQIHLEKKIEQRDLASWKLNTPFRFCMTKEADGFSTSFCSRQYILVSSDVGFEVKGSTTEFEAQAALNGQKGKRKGSFASDKTSPKVAFEAQLVNGTTYRIETSPIISPIIDIVGTNDKESAVLTGKDRAPNATRVENLANETWKATIPLDHPSLYFYGTGNILFRQDFKFAKPLPTEDMRPKLSRRTRATTYISSVPVKGAFEKTKSKVSSQEVEAASTTDKEFDWSFGTPNHGEVNRSHIKMLIGQDEYTGYQEIYRGYPFEAAGRFSALFTNSSQVVVLGELRATAWAEQLFSSAGWSVQHWGLAAKYVQALAGATDSSGNPITLTTVNVNLNFRFTPGVWNQDKTFGLALGYQNVTYSSITGAMAGPGVFWGAPLGGSGISKLLNGVRIFRYPQWIDAQFYYYAIPSGDTLNINFDLDGHLKFFIRPNFFYELGLGYKQFDYTNTSTGIRAQASAIFSSAGIGIIF